MRFIFHLAVWFAVLFLLINAALYVWRARALARAAGCDVSCELGLLHCARAFGVEWISMMVAVLLIPIGWLIPRCRSGTGERTAVILVHGWALNRGAFWLLRRRLLHDGWGPVCCFEYRSARAAIERAAQDLGPVVNRLAAETQRPVVLIGHSIGGLVLRYYARHYYPKKVVRRIVTIGTPHAGTELARLSGKVAKLSPGSDFLGELNADDPAPEEFDVIAIQSTFDAMVLPPTAARYTGAFNIRVDDVGHNALLFSRKIYHLLRENLEAPLT